MYLVLPIYIWPIFDLLKRVQLQVAEIQDAFSPGPVDAGAKLGCCVGHFLGRLVLRWGCNCDFNLDETAVAILLRLEVAVEWLTPKY
jgi:hypothetical protein